MAMAGMTARGALLTAWHRLPQPGRHVQSQTRPRPAWPLLRKRSTGLAGRPVPRRRCPSLTRQHFRKAASPPRGAPPVWPGLAARQCRRLPVRNQPRGAQQGSHISVRQAALTTALRAQRAARRGSADALCPAARPHGAASRAVGSGRRRPPIRRRQRRSRCAWLRANRGATRRGGCQGAGCAGSATGPWRRRRRRFRQWERRSPAAVPLCRCSAAGMPSVAPSVAADEAAVPSALLAATLRRAAEPDCERQRRGGQTHRRHLWAEPVRATQLRLRRRGHCAPRRTAQAAHERKRMPLHARGARRRAPPWH